VKENFETICWSHGLGNPNYDAAWQEIERKCCTRIEELLQGIDSSLEEVIKVDGKYYRMEK
jgi:hypothetical protein